MFIFFTEDDLMSFGEYMVSDKRRENIKNHPDAKEGDVDDLSKNVYRADLVAWLQETKDNAIIE